VLCSYHVLYAQRPKRRPDGLATLVARARCQIRSVRRKTLHFLSTRTCHLIEVDVNDALIGEGEQLAATKRVGRCCYSLCSGAHFLTHTHTHTDTCALLHGGILVVCMLLPLSSPSFLRHTRVCCWNIAIYVGLVTDAVRRPSTLKVRPTLTIHCWLCCVHTGVAHAVIMQRASDLPARVLQHMGTTMGCARATQGD